jgi:hypothetical protein
MLAIQQVGSPRQVLVQTWLLTNFSLFGYHVPEDVLEASGAEPVVQVSEVGKVHLNLEFMLDAKTTDNGKLVC